MSALSENPGKMDNRPQSASGHLNCPICLEVYRNPRALPCLHTFCQTCIHSYIVKAGEKTLLMTTLDCPVCRKPTAPPTPDKPPAEWAGDFPLNYAILPMLEPTESESRKMCEQCTEESGTDAAAQSYCKDCRQYLCHGCVWQHNRWVPLQNHTLISLDEMTSEIDSPVYLGQVENCSVHSNKKIKYFCQDHNTLCCSSCAIVKHRGCKQVLEVSEQGQEVKDGEKSGQMKAEMDSLQTHLAEITEILETNTADLDTQVDAIIQKMTDIRNKVVQIFDDLLVRVTSKCHRLKKQHSTEIADRAFTQRSLIAALSSSCSMFESVLKRGTQSQIFIAFHKLQAQLDGYKQMVKETRDTSSITALHLDIDKEVDSLIKSSKSLASVTVKQSRLDIKDPTAPKPIPIADCLVEKSPVVDIQKQRQFWQPRYTAAVYLKDGRLVTVDSSNRQCCLLDHQYNVTANINLPANPSDLALLQENKVAVVLEDINSTIQVVEVGKCVTIAGTIPCTRKPVCVARAGEGELMVGWETGFSRVSVSGEEKNYVRTDSVGREIIFWTGDRIAIDITRARVYKSTFIGSTMVCYGFDGQCYFTYGKDMFLTGSLAIDRDGNVYICSRGTNQVHQITPSGRRISMLELGIRYPFTVCFNREGDQMLVIDCSPSNKAVKVKFVPPN